MGSSSPASSPAGASPAAATEVIRCRTLVVGSGLAGMYFALEVADRGPVVLLTKTEPESSNTRWAQGGISAVFDESDSLDAHVEDTLRVGAGLCSRTMVERAVGLAPHLVRRLADEYGCNFDLASDEASFSLGREGGHSHRRVVHQADTTGAEIVRALLERVGAHPNITLVPQTMVVDLLSWSKVDGTRGCFGAYVQGADGRVRAYVAPLTVLAAGGGGKVYRYTSNPDVATADGVAIAYRLGATVANLEFMQFHPTCLFHPDAKSFLVSEAVRGEGGVLRRRDGSDLMASRHPMGSLAPRDVVAREIDAELKRSGDASVLLDTTHLDPQFVARRFPGIFERCLALGIDMRTEPLPVVPAAHYMCGGVAVDPYGRTDVPGLLAIGEVAMSGMHGACRLASNSLLEALTLAHGAAEIADEFGRAPPERVSAWNEGDAVDSDERFMVSANWEEVRALMWNFVGIVRSDKRLARARRRIELLRDEIQEYYWRFRVTRDVLELRNIALVGHLIIECARRRRESRGLHFTLDYPETNPEFQCDTVFNKRQGPDA